MSPYVQDQKKTIKGQRQKGRDVPKRTDYNASFQLVKDTNA